MLQCMSLFMARSDRYRDAAICLQLADKRKSLAHARNDAVDPNRTSASRVAMRLTFPASSSGAPA